MEKQDFSLLNDIPGLRFMPVRENKVPIIKGWQTSTEVHDLSSCVYVGLVCGIPSGNIEVIDIDQKYSLDGKLFENYKTQIHLSDPLLLQKLVVQKTKNGGFHFIYRCDKIGGNAKLANRFTTAAEKKDTYDKTFRYELTNEKNKDGEDGAKKVAEKASSNDKVRVLLETRGEGGQIVCSPSPGYEIIHGDLYGIKTITEDERDTLFSIARGFNEVFEEVVVPIPQKTKKGEGLSVFDDYNDRADVVSFLENYGWKVVGSKGRKTIFLRPGQTTAQSSGNYDHDKKWFSVFTTSTEFQPERAYLPYAVYATLECGGNFSEASQRLYDLGYGVRKTDKIEIGKPSTRVIQSRIDLNNNDISFLAVEGDYKEYIHQVRTGTLQLGLTTGSPSLDEHFLFKEGNLLITNGIDNTGKSVFTWYLYLLAAMYHNWSGVILSSENTVGNFMRKMIQFYWGKPLYGEYAMTDIEYKVAHDFVSKHFKVIKAQEDLYNYKDVINMNKKARDKYPELKFGMIDPYNSLKIDLSGFSKLSTHEYHYEALSEIKSYGQQTNFSWVVNNHAVTSALRMRDADKKYSVAPRKEDTEGGGKFGAKADDFITIHRITNHPTDWMVTEVHIRKIKDTETGGRPTSIDMPVKFEMYKGQCGFRERLEFGGSPVDPVLEWHKKNGTFIQTELIPNVTWTPYANDNETDIGF